MKNYFPVFVSSRNLRLSALPIVLGMLGMNAHAQRVHVSDSPLGSGLEGLIGESPDVSTWPHPAAPDGNPFPRSTAPLAELVRRDNKVLLGKSLFWEEQVGIDSTMACGTCHDTGAGGADGRGSLFPHSAGTFGSAGVIPQSNFGGDVKYGFQLVPTPSEDRSVTGIIAPPMIGAYLYNQLFWDMRAGPSFEFEGVGAPTIPGFGDWAACEELSTGPPLSDVEMGHESLTWSSFVLQKKIGNSFPMALCDPSPATMPQDFQDALNIGGDYNWWFDKVFNLDPDPTLAGGSGVTRERFAAAVAHYMRTLIPDQAPIDLGTMTISQQNGFAKLDSLNCFKCHSVAGATLTSPAGGFVDPFDALLSNGRFRDVRGVLVKTPSLRNVGLKRRFFTDGQVDNFPDLLTFYEGHFGFTLTTIETAEVTDFLTRGLLDNRVAARLKPFDKPVLASERPEHVFEMNEFGAAISGVSTPEIIANSPAYLPPPGRPVYFKVGVANCLPGMKAQLQIVVPPSTVPITFPTEITNAEGFATTFVSLPLPAIGLGGPVTFTANWIVKDPGAPGNIARSNSARWTTFNY